MDEAWQQHISTLLSPAASINYNMQNVTNNKLIFYNRRLCYFHLFLDFLYLQLYFPDYTKLQLTTTTPNGLLTTITTTFGFGYLVTTKQHFIIDFIFKFLFTTLNCTYFPGCSHGRFLYFDLFGLNRWAQFGFILG